MNISNLKYKSESLLIDENKHEILRHGTIGCPLHVYSVKKTDFAQNVQIEHWHDEIEIFMVEEGACLFTIDLNGKQSIPLRKGAMVFVPPRVLHGALTLQQEPCKFIAVVFHPRFLQSHQSDTAEKLLRETVELFWKHPCVVPLGPNGSEYLVNLIYKLRTIFTEHRKHSELLLKSCLLEVFYTYRSTLDSEPEVNQAELENAIAPSLSFIHENYGSVVSITDIAAANNCSVTYLERLYHRILNTTPINYLITYRLYIAGTLLTTTNDRVSEIATKVGFNDFSYFGKCFKQYYKVSPREYRKKQMEQKEAIIEKYRRTYLDQFAPDLYKVVEKDKAPEHESQLVYIKEDR